MRKTNKAVAKRFKITGTGKVVRQRAGRRHLAASKKSSKRRSSRRDQTTHWTDTHRVILNLPFSH
jgi:large subunit ribosomal protein L35